MSGVVAILFTATSFNLSAQEQNSTTISNPWTLEQCINYAMEHNIQLQQRKLTKEQSTQDVAQNKAGLLPSLSFSSNHNVAWRPWSESFTNLSGGTMTQTSSEVNYNGSYGLNANWTVWNGGRNYKNVKRSEVAEEMSEYDIEETANSIQEQILQYYVQILYQAEAVNVCKEVLAASKMQRDRGQVMVDVGSLARVDLAQLESQVSQDEYTLVNNETQLANYKLKLKQLLELVNTEDFDIVIPTIDDSRIMATLPSKSEVWSAAYASRPEIRNNQLSIQSADLDIDIARRGYLPSISLSAGIGTSSSSGQSTSFPEQWKTNLSNSIGLTLSIPIFDNRQNKTNVAKARLSKMSSELTLLNTEKELYSQIETYWLNARNAQQQYQYAKKNTDAMQASYDLVSEQFKVGLKNIVELTTGKNNLLQAQQQLLQSKYTALLNISMLRFYAGERIQL